MFELIINGNLFNVKTVISKRDIQNGMMGRKFDSDFNGMLFIMNPGNHSFWMKGCEQSLDIIFIDGNKVTKVYENCPPCREDECKSYDGNGDMVLELDGNSVSKYDIKIGDSVVIKN